MAISSYWFFYSYYYAWDKYSILIYKRELLAIKKPKYWINTKLTDFNVFHNLKERKLNRKGRYF
ncbi:MAG: hypothetical protein EAX86_00325 [Candidatus Heimdallarchaeota archaeon]|nr:hypothetical protein [Candidatus Heimdallarchaeota archaeon]